MAKKLKSMLSTAVSGPAKMQSFDPHYFLAREADLVVYKQRYTLESEADSAASRVPGGTWQSVGPVVVIHDASNPYSWDDHPVSSIQMKDGVTTFVLSKPDAAGKTSYDYGKGFKTYVVIVEN